MLNAVLYGGSIGLGLGVAGGAINIVTRTLFGTGWVSWALSTGQTQMGGSQ
tara:strand:+ start:1700 stop:1852 length:153 start_codon:yes stop_codon:yes gene_type:complete